MDTGRLLIAFLGFGAACATLWAWMLANTATPDGGAMARTPRSEQ
jgi:hypothetical protein